MMPNHERDSAQYALMAIDQSITCRTLRPAPQCHARFRYRTTSMPNPTVAASRTAPKSTSIQSHVSRRKIHALSRSRISSSTAPGRPRRSSKSALYVRKPSRTAYASDATATAIVRHLLANWLVSINAEKMKTQSVLTRKMSLLWRRTNNCITYSYVLRPSPDHPQSYGPRGCPNGKNGQKSFSWA